MKLSEKEKIKFRANLIIIKIAFKAFIKITSRKSLKLEDLYISIGTTRENYTNCCNGKTKSEGPTKTMINTVQDNKFMLQAISGERLIVVDRFDGEDDWKKLFDYKEKDPEEYSKGIGEIEKSIKTYIENFKNLKEQKRSFDSIANNDNFKYECFDWIAGNIVDADNYNKQSLDALIIKRAEKFLGTTFDELDKCSDETLKKIFDDNKKLQSKIMSIINYRQYKNSRK